MNKSILFLVLVILAALAASGTIFTVNETEKAIKFKFGEIVKADYEPGLNLKIPIINTVNKYDRRILTLDATPERFLTAEKKYVIVDSFVKWRIADVSRYYTSTQGDERTAAQRLTQIMKDGLRREFGRRDLADVVSAERNVIMDAVRIQTQEVAVGLGIEVVDVRIKRIDLPDDVSNSVFARMRAERARVANDFRSRGREASERIRADADRQAAVIVAEAYRDAQRIRGAGDAQATDTYARAYGADEDFYSFHRSLQAYRATFRGKDDLFVLEPDSEFFRFLGTAGRGE
jgi:membrane protease subunit HflC